jgi:hypothetical protein
VKNTFSIIAFRRASTAGWSSQMCSYSPICFEMAELASAESASGTKMFTRFLLETLQDDHHSTEHC